MKFKKRNLTEEIGLPRSNKKTFTKNKKQKVRITETQLQRLLGIISEQNVNTPGAPNPKDYKKGGQDPKYLADKKAFLKKYKAKKGKPKPTTGTGPTNPPAPNFNMSTWSPGFKKKVDTFLKNKNIKGAERFLKGKVDGWKKKTMKAGPKWKKQLKAKTDFAMKLMKDVKKAATKKPLNENKQLLTEWWLLAIQLWKVWVSWKEWRDQKVVPGDDGDNDPKEWAEFKSQYSGKLEQLKRESGKMPNSWRELEQLANEGMRDNKPQESPLKPQTSPVKKMCCRDRNGVITSAVNGRCPKSSTKVPCKGTPPTQGNITTENRTLKTTNPITESEIKDMKKWFNRVNKTGREYNPGRL